MVYTKHSFRPAMYFTFKVETRTPSSGFNQNEQYRGIQKKDMKEQSQGNMISMYMIHFSGFDNECIIVTWCLCQMQACAASVGNPYLSLNERYKL